ncbi:hypothetical protein L1987_15516 [Smallanthus sonchifolius]|uniref:Uncharacterized protein n=1 Tax=Smallanthus sonchifolius TaxID=185202 RepID=A0ACB9J7B3_9ASTR|nr:hypothetical protein L1987_15516 [Smallanthus sonchifolius]
MAVVCETYSLPLAQTWVPCRHRSVLACGGGFKKSCNSFDGSCMGQVCMSTTDVAFYVVEAHMWGFRDAYAEHHLQKGQGVAGRAFATRSLCFCENITHFGKSEYPLVHYARLFGLVGCFPICLTSTHTDDDDYILEFFLPPNMVDCKDQQTFLGSLLTSMNHYFCSLKVASGEEIGEDGRFAEIIKAYVKSDAIDSGIQLIQPSESAVLKAMDKGKKPMVVEKIACSEGKYKTAAILLPREAIEKQFGRTMKEAAKNLHVSLSTLKRKCIVLGISEWPGPNLMKKKAINSYIIQVDTNEEDNRAIQDPSNVNMNKNTLTIKAAYADDMLKFHLPSQATFVAVENEIGMRFKLSVGSYKLKYLDEDGDWISLISDEGIRSFLFFEASSEWVCLDCGSQEGEGSSSLGEVEPDFSFFFYLWPLLLPLSFLFKCSGMLNLRGLLKLNHEEIKHKRKAGRKKEEKLEFQSLVVRERPGFGPQLFWPSRIDLQPSTESIRAILGEEKLLEAKFGAFDIVLLKGERLPRASLMYCDSDTER